MSVQASAIINSVRDLIPDPVYSADGTPQPSTDGGLFRAQSLYRWLNDGVKALVSKTDWVVEDWTAVSLTNHIPHYDLNSAWQSLDEVFLNGWRLGRAAEGYLMWPQKVETAQAVCYALHNVTDHWNLRFFPAPNITDPATTLTGSLTDAATTLTVGSATGFLPYGFLLVDSELVQYYNVSGTTLTGVLRGIGGTTAVAHANNAPVTHCAGWIKGMRTPREIAAATDLVEVPSSFQYPLQLYVLARCRQSENEFSEASSLMQQFQQECEARKTDPKLKMHQGLQVRPYGDPVFGSLAWGRAVVS